MHDESVEDEVLRLKTLQAHETLARTDYLRGVHRLSLELSERELSVALTVRPETIRDVLEEAGRLPAVRDGFHGGDPIEIVNRFVAGQITHEQVVDELTRWPYAPSHQLDGPLDDILGTVPGSFDDVARTARAGLLPPDVYIEILDRREAQSSSNNQNVPLEAITDQPELHS